MKTSISLQTDGAVTPLPRLPPPVTQPRPRPVLLRLALQERHRPLPARRTSARSKLAAERTPARTSPRRPTYTASTASRRLPPTRFKRSTPFAMVTPRATHTASRPWFVAHPYLSTKWRAHWVWTQNGLTTYPYLGAVVGFASTSDDLGAGSYNYAYIIGTTECASHLPGSLFMGQN